MSIQRFNEDKKFGVFLLSTKAGGLGINLATARVVIIFDSDWNPQNDLQAIARAHRIGQKYSVQVYRLITSDTYEQQMFQRASMKLGMEQAIFAKGAFNHAKSSSKGNIGKMKNDQKEVEDLLKYGAYAFLNEDDGKQKEIEDLDIDKIIQMGQQAESKNGAYSYDKVKFDTSKEQKNLPDFSNSKFWDKVFADDAESIPVLHKRFKNDNKRLMKNDSALTSFLNQLQKSVDVLIKTMQESGIVDELVKEDERKVRYIIDRIFKSKTVETLTKELAGEIMENLTEKIHQQENYAKSKRKIMNSKSGTGPKI